ncbi:glycosyltransferase [Sinirhodobacter ferrireducens]|uniref:Glycosyltransferase n=1 Tax=Paenirhodobacter ferrireducens TaxID=1215032 RepID=A0A443LCR1_9RHOB|nr:glycosyltransferase [Sinirhodobacter ferrireducens]RWR46981.1 glycosyltransferase [Sinirhodobacter ferrireducens]
MSRHPALEPRPMLAPVVTGAKALRYRLVIALWLVVAGWFWAWWLQPAHVIGPWRYWLVTAAMIWIWGMQLYFVLIFLFARHSVAPDPVPGRWRVAMVTTKTPSEPFAVVRKTLEAMLAQDYPHDTWLADEDPSEETRAWCAAHRVMISTRKGLAEYHRAEWPRRTRCKEGNLAYFYDTWGYRDYDIVSQLDADHVPQPGYLREMLRPFADPEVGYVSAPSICAANAAESWAARTRLYAEAAFHGVFQAGYTGVLTPMCIGSHYAVRTVALQQAGGLGPELAEDHSTTMLVAAAGWRGVHAIDAIAVGDGPATLPDLVTQEFQWSRSLMSLLLRYTPSYLGRLPLRLKLLFLLCQSWYAFFAVTMASMYVLPILAVCFDIRFADVTYPAFLGHSLPSVAVMIAFAYMMRHDGLFRPRDAKVIAWEKALFVILQWPWVLWGCLMAVWDRVTGRFVDFRITPKGEAAAAVLPPRIFWLYLLLAAGAIVPVLTVSSVTEARGFYLLSIINALLYVTLLVVILWHHRSEARAKGQALRDGAEFARYVFGLTLVMALCLGGIILRGDASLRALAVGLVPLKLTRVEYIVSGAGKGQSGDVHVRFAPDLAIWFSKENGEGEK